MTAYTTFEAGELYNKLNDPSESLSDILSNPLKAHVLVSNTEGTALDDVVAAEVQSRLFVLDCEESPFGSVSAAAPSGFANVHFVEPVMVQVLDATKNFIRDFPTTDKFKPTLEARVKLLEKLLANAKKTSDMLGGKAAKYANAWKLLWDLLAMAFRCPCGASEAAAAFFVERASEAFGPANVWAKPSYPGTLLRFVYLRWGGIIVEVQFSELGQMLKVDKINDDLLWRGLNPTVDDPKDGKNSAYALIGRIVATGDRPGGFTTLTDMVMDLLAHSSPRYREEFKELTPGSEALTEILSLVSEVDEELEACLSSAQAESARESTPPS